MNAETFSGLKFRSIGPAVASGRVMSIAVNPKNKFEYYVGVASGGVWKTVNDGTTWTPLFDKEGRIRLGGWRSIRMIRRWCGWERARAIRSAAFRMAMEFTGRMMAGKIGRIWD